MWATPATSSTWVSLAQAVPVPPCLSRHGQSRRWSGQARIQLCAAARTVLENNVQIPADRVKARVQGGWVTLEGEVDYAFQRREVERMVRNVRGVLGVANLITVTPPVTTARVKEEIEEAFKREAEVDARHISVEISDHTAKLYGHVHSMQELNAATAAAAAAPGVATVESHLVVSP
jgi:osmotically-inducible protein OsmY